MHAAFAAWRLSIVILSARSGYLAARAIASLPMAS